MEYAGLSRERLQCDRLCDQWDGLLWFVSLIMSRVGMNRTEMRTEMRMGTTMTMREMAVYDRFGFNTYCTSVRMWRFQKLGAREKTLNR